MNKFLPLSAHIKNNWPVILLLVLACLTRFLFLSYPTEVVFDEVHFGQFVGAYSTHQYYFDIHPPLGKLMIAGFVKVFNFHDSLNFSQIGNSLNPEDIYLLRFLPAFFGVLFVLLIYFLARKIGLSKRASFLASFLVIFDNAILIESKFILVDVFLLFFGFLSLYFLVSYDKAVKYSAKSYIFLGLAAISASLAFSIKWTALTFFAVIAIFILIKSFKGSFKRAVLNFAIIIILPFLVYYSVFLIHFHVLNKTGPGDAFMSTEFQRTLSGNQTAVQMGPTTLSQWQKFVELNQKMYYFNSNLKATHPYSSKWYQWPLDKRPIWYWNKNTGALNGSIYLLGNPFVWWPVLFAVIYSVIILASKNLRKKLPPIIYLFLFGYCLSLFPFILIGRVAFLYHYLPSLVFGIIILAILFDKFLYGKNGKNFFDLSENVSLAIYHGFLLGALLFFITFSPLIYGFMIPSATSSSYNGFINFLLK